MFYTLVNFFIITNPGNFCIFLYLRKIEEKIEKVHNLFLSL